ncbi:MAG TPA: flagellar basal body L-ring protein FlgH [Geminicoccus sp.]|uniref:flagellar basal body L-ring protein FlgH n=1 Tax=Geminicoccus sp. TaxID=2024832 RepID=UPI002E371144|nr:flagellar basal body L-ring protein FlgH [Geminicoccus sp.]HEX2525527.1 flagellar basal body L-ring protein FlgH [Geminicoccus sp.]
MKRSSCGAVERRKRPSGLHARRWPWPLALPLLLGACGISERLEMIGKAPPLTPIENPVTAPGYQPVSLPMPEHELEAPSAGANSLWRSGARAFFKDQRAREVGDVLTVRVTMADSAELSNESTRSRKNSEELGVDSLFGVADAVRQLLPEEEDEDFVGLESRSANRGHGTVSRDEAIKVSVAAVVLQKLPNGNLVIRGRQEIRVNFEVRELLLAGIVRPEDITADNTISHEKIAELRVAYGGRGQITDVQQPRYGQQALDILLPF